MERALDLATRGAGLAPPNPMVGAVAVASDGAVVGEGWHEGPGTPHAEVVALRAARERARGGILYLTLEPCTHHGRTPPCAPMVRDAGLDRVVVAARDPNPVVDGRGLALLRASGLAVTDGVLGEEGERLIEGFARHVRTGLPFVTLKLASSLDGKAAASDRTARWITGDSARADAHRLRARSDAVVVGAGTVADDDPALTVRLDGYRGRQPLRVVVDGSGRTPSTARVFDGAAPVLVATTGSAPGVRDAWESAGAEVIALDQEPGSSRVDLRALMAALGKRGLQSVLIEGGPTIAWSAIQTGVADRIVLYIGAKLLGGTDAPGILGGRGAPTIADSISVRIRSVDRLGEDIKVEADVHRDR